MKIGIIGMGFVGGALYDVLQGKHEVIPFDKYKREFYHEDRMNEIAKNAEVIFLCLPTPMKSSGEMDSSILNESLTLLLEKTTEESRDPKEILVVFRSTAVPGTTDKLSKKYPFRFVFNPEFLREKYAREDMQNTDRVVLGAENREDFEKIKEIYSSLFPDANYLFVNGKTSEMIKYAANVFLAGQVTIANEIYRVCKALGVDYEIVKKALLLDDRIARNIDVPGPDGDFGFGGKCFPKDLNALIYIARENGYKPYLLEDIWRSNERFRTNPDWLKIPGAISENKNFK